jgi:hypothetical protein
MTNEEIAATLAEYGNRIKVSEKRIDDLEGETKSIHHLAISVEKLAISTSSLSKQIDAQSEQIEKQSEKIDHLEQRKGDTAIYWIRIIAGAVATGIVGYILGLLLK